MPSTRRTGRLRHFQAGSEWRHIRPPVWRHNEEIIDNGSDEGVQQGVQQGLQQGMQQGMLEGIELGLSLKFGDKSVALMDLIKKISDVNKLRSIKEAIKVVNSIDDIKLMLN